jgi:nucleoside-diphosphate-sugar epimerase
MNTIIGHTGFVGSNLCDNINFSHKYNSKNINDIIDTDHDVIYCCGISANKFWANKNGGVDKQNIDDLINTIKSVKCNQFILISTIDVYSDLSNKNEDDNKCDKSHHAYGWNRYYAENKLGEIFGDKLQIIRLPALFGNNLKKNILYDLKNKTFFGKVNLDNKLQFYHVDNLAKDIQYMVDKNIKELNLFTEPIPLGEIVDKFFEYNDEIMYKDIDSSFVYDLRTKYLESGYWLNKENVLNDLKKWLKEY